MGEHAAHRDGLGRDVEAAADGEGREVAGQGLVDVERAPFGSLHDRDGGERLGQGAGAVGVSGVAARCLATSASQKPWAHSTSFPRTSTRLMARIWNRSCAVRMSGARSSPAFAPGILGHRILRGPSAMALSPPTQLQQIEHDRRTVLEFCHPCYWLDRRTRRRPLRVTPLQLPSPAGPQGREGHPGGLRCGQHRDPLAQAARHQVAERAPDPDPGRARRAPGQAEGKQGPSARFRLHDATSVTQKRNCCLLVSR
jgi:hypothetical protein